LKYEIETIEIQPVEKEAAHLQILTSYANTSSYINPSRDQLISQQAALLWIQGLYCSKIQNK
jgi:hypothetical protein